jgi:hypothetical protein
MLKCRHKEKKSLLINEAGILIITYIPKKRKLKENIIRIRNDKEIKFNLFRMTKKY